MQYVLRMGRRIGIAIAGGLVIVLGIILLPLPGPGTLVIAAGLGILSLEFEWPRLWLRWARLKVRALLRQARAWWQQRC